MAAIVTKIGQQGFGRTSRVDRRQGRVVRVSAKKAARRVKDEGDDEPELDAEALADADGEVEVEVAAKKARPDSGTYLSMYFRDMAALDVLRPEEEFTSAREIEALEIMLWEAVLAHAPAIDHVLGAVEVVVPQLPPEVRSLRKAAEDADARTWSKLVGTAARKLRSSDVDHLFIDAALCTIDRLTLGIGVRGSTVGALGRERARVEWLRRVRGREPRRRRRAQRLREGEPAARRQHRAPLQPRADGARRSDPGGQHRPDEGRRALRLPPRLPVLDLRELVDPPRDQPRARRQGARGPPAGPHDRRAAPPDQGAPHSSTGQLGRQPTSEELATATQMPLDKIEKMRSWLLEQSVSIDKPVGDDEGRVLGEVLEDPDREAVSPTEDLEWEALTTEVRDLLRELRPIEADILRQRFGLGTEQELTLKEIGDKYNLSRERIRQLQEQALAKMRRALARRDLM